MTDPQFLANIIKQFQYYKLLGEQTFDQISDEELFWRYNPESAHHVGQIVYIGRMIKGSDWKSLSIPKGGSVTYNTDKFSKDKVREHFSDELINKLIK